MLEKILTILFFSLSFALFGQGKGGLFRQSNEKMVIARYKNGGVYIGEKITETKETVTIRLKNQAAIEDEEYDNVITLNKEKAHRYFDSNNALIYDKGKYLKTTGTYGIYGFGVGLSGLSSNVDLAFGWRFKERFAVGFGVGFDANEVNVDRFFLIAQFVSGFVDSKYYLTNSKNRIFASGKMGYGIAIPDPFDDIAEIPIGGLKLNLGLGIHFSTRKDMSYIVSIENYFQKTSGIGMGEDFIDNPIIFNYDIWIKRLLLKFEVDL